MPNKVVRVGLRAPMRVVDDRPPQHGGKRDEKLQKTGTKNAIAISPSEAEIADTLGAQGPQVGGRHTSRAPV